MERLNSLLRASVPIIIVRTSEEVRFIDSLIENFEESHFKNKICVWSCEQGLVDTWSTDTILRAKDKSKDPNQALKAISEHNLRKDYSKYKGIIYVMRDFHKHINDRTARHLRDLYYPLTAQSKTIIITTPTLSFGPLGKQSGIESTLEKNIAVIDFELPSHQELVNHIKETLISEVDKEYGDKDTVKTNYTDQELHEIARACQGLTLDEVDVAITTSFTHLNHINTEYLHQEKKGIIQKTDILEFYDNCPSIDEVGGMDQAKEFFESYANAWTEEAQEYGVEALKGVLLTGVPGTGKSLLAKAMSRAWGLPIVRMDVGKIMAGIVGQSESRMREGIRLAEAISPCILWIDEIEKALSGTKSSNFSDGGTLSRVFGTLLTSMQEGMNNVTVVATANDITSLPPELIRRFDEVFFVDLPTDEEREEIFRIHLQKRKRNPDNINLDEVIKASKNYTGAEIEKAIKDAIARAWTSKSKEITSKDLIHSIQRTKPISTVMSEKITTIRNWARDRARYASSAAEIANRPGNQKVLTEAGEEISVDEALNFEKDIKTNVEIAEESKKSGRKRHIDLE